MGDLTKNISRKEVSCKCGCGQATIDYELLDTFQCACDLAAERLKRERSVVIISSANRCISYNKQIGACSRSWHLSGLAIDSYIVELDHIKWFLILKEATKKRGKEHKFDLKIYSWGVHFERDLRKSM